MLLNVWGIKKANEVGFSKNYVDNLCPEADVLYLQRRKIQGDKEDMTSKKSWENNSCWALKASPSDDDEDISVGVSCGRSPCAFTPNCCSFS
jgi:hypothetical protein